MNNALIAAVVILIVIVCSVIKIRKESATAAKAQKQPAPAPKNEAPEQLEAAEAKTRKELQDRVDMWNAKLEKTFATYQFSKTAEHLCHDADLRRRATVPETGAGELVILPIWSKGLFMDDHSRQMIFAWLTDFRGLGNYTTSAGYRTERIRYDDVLSCEVQCDVDRTLYADTTSARERGTLYVNTSVSASDRIASLSVKLTLRSTSSPSFVLELITPRSACADERLYRDFANEVCDAVNAAARLR